MPRTWGAAVRISGTASLWIQLEAPTSDRKSTRLNSSHLVISYAVFCLKKKKITMGILLDIALLGSGVALFGWLFEAGMIGVACAARGLNRRILFVAQKTDSRPASLHL